jgi:hypothetical protein
MNGWLQLALALAWTLLLIFWPAHETEARRRERKRRP